MGYSLNFKHQQPLIAENMTIQDVLKAVTLNNDYTINIYGTDHATLDGTCIRDFLHIEDLAKSHLAALIKIRMIDNTEIINVGTGIGISILNLIRKFSERKNIRIHYIDKGKRPGEISVSYADVGKAKKVIDWSSTLSLDDIIDAI